MACPGRAGAVCPPAMYTAPPSVNAAAPVVGSGRCPATAAAVIFRPLTVCPAAPGPAPGRLIRWMSLVMPWLVWPPKTQIWPPSTATAG